MPIRYCLHCRRPITVGARHDCRTHHGPPRSGRPWRRTIQRILKRDNHRCHHCGGPANTADHLIPRAKGGTDDDTNLVASCTPCNLRKGAT